MLTTDPKYFTPDPTSQEIKSPSLSDRLANLFGLMKERQQAEQEKHAESFSELVEQLAEEELSGKGKLPSPEQVESILEAAGKTPADLSVAVERTAKIKRLRSALKDEPAAQQALETTQQSVKDQEEKLQQFIASHETKMQELAASLAEQKREIERFSRLRQELNQLAPPASPREQELKDLIAQSVKQEGQIMTRAGGSVLPQKYIDKPLEFFRQELTEAEQMLESETKRGRSRPELVEQVETLRRSWPQTESRCQLGQEIRDLREQRKAYAEEREQLVAARQVAA